MTASGLRRMRCCTSRPTAPSWWAPAEFSNEFDTVRHAEQIVDNLPAEYELQQVKVTRGEDADTQTLTPDEFEAWLKENSSRKGKGILDVVSGETKIEYVYGVKRGDFSFAKTLAAGLPQDTDSEFTFKVELENGKYDLDGETISYTVAGTEHTETLKRSFFGKYSFEGAAQGGPDRPGHESARGHQLHRLRDRDGATTSSWPTP